ncbi:MAG: phosphinothricin acetyltransferase, partial [Acidocella sp.]|nr:phosphinothricin acetyltransferase [Acidocella sp.]
MTSLLLLPVRCCNGPDLVQMNLDNRTYHQPWAQPFTTINGFESWFDDQSAGANACFIASDPASGLVVGVTNLSQIFMKGFQNAYLGFWGTEKFAGHGLMTEAV